MLGDIITYFRGLKKCNHHKTCQYVNTAPDSFCMNEGGGPYCGEWRFLEAHKHTQKKYTLAYDLHDGRPTVNEAEAQQH